MPNKYNKYVDFDTAEFPIVRTYHPSGFIDDKLFTDEPELIQTVVKIWIDWCCVSMK